MISVPKEGTGRFKGKSISSKAHQGFGLSRRAAKRGERYFSTNNLLFKG